MKLVIKKLIITFEEGNILSQGGFIYRFNSFKSVVIVLAFLDISVGIGESEYLARDALDTGPDVRDRGLRNPLISVVFLCAAEDMETLHRLLGIPGEDDPVGLSLRMKGRIAPSSSYILSLPCILHPSPPCGGGLGWGG